MHVDSGSAPIELWSFHLLPCAIRTVLLFYRCSTGIVYSSSFRNITDNTGGKWYQPMDDTTILKPYVLHITKSMRVPCVNVITGCDVHQMRTVV